MEDNQRHQILDDLAGIIDAAGEKLSTEASADRDALHRALQIQFRMTPRQADLALSAIAAQTLQAAQQLNTTPADFLGKLQAHGRIAMFAFTAGCVHQHDMDHLLDPETGERLQ